MISKKYEIGSGEVGTVTIEYGGSSMSFQFMPPLNKKDLDRFVPAIMWEFRYVISKQFEALGYKGDTKTKAERLLINASLLGNLEQSTMIKEAMDLLDLG